MTVGFLSLASNVVPAISPCLRRLYDTLMATSQTHQIPVSSEIKKHFCWWMTFLPQWNGIELLHHPRQISRIWADPSAQEQIGGYLMSTGETLSSIHTPAQIFSTVVRQQLEETHTNFKEMYAVLHALCTWTTNSRACRIKRHCDNAAVVAALAKRSTNGQAISPYMQISIHIALNNIELHCVWIRVSLEIKKNLSWWMTFLPEWTESNCYTTHGKSYGNGQTHLHRKGLGAISSDQEKPCPAYTHRPSSSVPWSNSSIKKNTSTSEKWMQRYTHCAPAQPSPEPVGSNSTSTTQQS